jgi:hypothetical protein
MVASSSISFETEDSFRQEVANLFGIESGGSESLLRYDRTRPLADALRKLQEAIEFSVSDEARKEGFGPIAKSVCHDSLQVFKGLFPEIIVPQVLCLPGHGIGLQWNGSNGSIFTISLFGSGLLSYAGIFSDNHRVRGTCSVAAPLAAELTGALFAHFPNREGIANGGRTAH